MWIGLPRDFLVVVVVVVVRDYGDDAFG